MNVFKPKSTSYVSQKQSKIEYFNIVNMLPVYISSQNRLADDLFKNFAPSTDKRMQRFHLSEENRSLVLHMYQRGDRQVDIAAYFNTSQSVISRLICRHRETGTTSRRAGSGSSRITTPRQDRCLVIQARRQPFETARQLQQHLHNATGVLISDQTVRNRLLEFGLTSYRPLRSPARTPAHRRQRLDWANHRLTEVTSWEHVLFTDESSYCIHNDSRRRRVYRSAGNRTLPQYIQPVVPFGGGGVMVWAGISLGWRTDLHVFNGRVTGQCYRDEIVYEYVAQSQDFIGPENFMFLDDNARPHRAQIVLEALEQLQINHLPLPPVSPDLNPIEQVWDMLQRQLNTHTPHPTTRRQLAELLPILWDEIPQQHIDNCILSMPDRCQAVINARGGATRY